MDSDLLAEIQAQVIHKTQEMRRQIILSIPYSLHQDRWGVPCGPTLDMIPWVIPDDINWHDYNNGYI